MKRRTRRNQSAGFKAIAAIKVERTIAQIGEQFDVHPNQVTTWKAQLEGGAAEIETAILDHALEHPWTSPKKWRAFLIGFENQRSRYG